MSKSAVNQNTDRDAESCGCAVADAENPARNLDSLGEADVRPDGDGQEHTPPATDDSTQNKAADYED
jgi:hypothetical protein